MTRSMSISLSGQKNDPDSGRNGRPPYEGYPVGTLSSPPCPSTGRPVCDGEGRPQRRRRRPGYRQPRQHALLVVGLAGLLQPFGGKRPGIRRISSRPLSSITRASGPSVSTSRQVQEGFFHLHSLSLELELIREQDCPSSRTRIVRTSPVRSGKPYASRNSIRIAPLSSTWRFPRELFAGQLLAPADSGNAVTVGGSENVLVSFAAEIGGVIEACSRIAQQRGVADGAARSCPRRCGCAVRRCRPPWQRRRRASR